MQCFDFFEQHVKRPQSELPRFSSAGFGPVTEINDEFLRFAAIRKSHELLRECFRFILMLSGTFNEEGQPHLPRTVDELVHVAYAFPAGIRYFADELVGIINHPCFEIYQKIAAIPVNGYYSIATKDISMFIRDEVALHDLVQMVNDLYLACEMVCSYHKKNGWAAFRVDMLEAESEDVFEMD